MAAAGSECAPDSISSPSLPSDDEPVLESGYDNQLPDQKRCCQFGCLDALDENQELKSRCDELRMALAGETLPNRRNSFQYEVLKQMVDQSTASEKSVRKFNFMNLQICRQSAASILATSRPRITRLVKWLAEGHSDPPQDQRMRQCKVTGTKEEADMVTNGHTMWAWIHEFLAEPLAEAPQLSQSEEMDVAVTIQKLL